MKNTLKFLAVLIIVSSCKTVIVHEEGAKVKGIPFYTQKKITKQETQYLYTWYEIKLIQNIEAANKTKESILSQKSISNKVVLGSLYAIEDLVLYMNSSGKEDSLSSIIKKIRNLPAITLPIDSSDLVLISNNWKSEVIVDYDTTYYLNSWAPLFGSSSLTQKLAANGTLSEVSATTDNQIDELINSAASLITPFSSIKVARIQAAKAGFVGISNITYKLVIEEKGYIFTFSKETSQPTEAIKANLISGNYTRTPWPAEPAKPQQEKKPTINVSGSIVLPEK